jgi:ketosteroid isomerase-like protein
MSADLVRELFRRVNSGGVEDAIDLLSEEFVSVVPPSMSAEPDVYEGHEGARRYFAGFEGLMEGVHFELLDLEEHGDTVLVWLRLVGRGAASGIDVELPAAVTCWIVDGKIARLNVHPTMDEARRALVSSR